ncbi:MAG: peptidoglycan bridge formation glycyltransferase FemA/FemB family protein [Patescibacteria group bacterium]|nr:peptidoglycan bridge formation glycyltransferase FemA/FemB family protein [Patescibacteria group bacterium]
MEIKALNERTVWDDFLRDVAPHTFLQTWGWGEFQRALGHHVFRLGFFERGLQGICLALLIRARRGTFLFVPHGPLVKVNDPRATKMFLEHLKQLARDNHARFLRVSPLLLDTPENRTLYSAAGFRPAPMHMHAERMWLLDLRASEAELLSSMRKNCRAAIRKAEKEDVEVSVGRDVKDLQHFVRLYQETSRRQHFVPFSPDYLQREFETFLKTDSAAIFLGRHHGEVRSAALIIFTATEAFYHQGASVIGDPVPVSHALQWAVIREAKRRGCQHYNFWGVSAEADSKHPWAGLSYFKRGFGGFEQEYLHAQDRILNWRYWPVFLLESLRRYKRNL